MGNSDGREQERQEAPPDETDPFAAYRRRLRRSYWTMGLQPVEPGDILTQENHGRVYELLPEDGMTLHVVDARGILALLVAVPEEQLPAFAEPDWRVDYRFPEPGRLVLDLVVGAGDPLDCPFEFDLNSEEQLQEAIQLTEREELSIFGVTHIEEGLMLTIKGTVPLPESFRDELRRGMLRALAGAGSQSQGST